MFFFVAGEIYELFIIASLLRFLLSGQKFWPPLLHFGESDRIRMIDRFISFARTRSLDNLSRDAHLRVARSDVHRDSILTLVFFKLKKKENSIKNLKIYYKAILAIFDHDSTKNSA